MHIQAKQGQGNLLAACRWWDESDEIAPPETVFDIRAVAV